MRSRTFSQAFGLILRASSCPRRQVSESSQRLSNLPWGNRRCGSSPCHLRCCACRACGSCCKPWRNRGGTIVSFSNGILNLTNWVGNVILPTLAGLFFVLAVLRFSRALAHYPAMYGGFLCLMGSGLVRTLATFTRQRSWNDPDVYWVSLVTLLNWIANVIMPLYAALEVAAGGVSLASGVGIHPPPKRQRTFLSAGLCLLLSGLLRLAEYFVAHGTGGVS